MEVNAIFWWDNDDYSFVPGQQVIARNEVQFANLHI